MPPKTGSTVVQYDFFQSRQLHVYLHTFQPLQFLFVQCSLLTEIVCPDERWLICETMGCKLLSVDILAYFSVLLLSYTYFNKW